MVHLDSCYESMEERTSNQKPDPEDMEIGLGIMIKCLHISHRSSAPSQRRKCYPMLVISHHSCSLFPLLSPTLSRFLALHAPSPIQLNQISTHDSDPTSPSALLDFDSGSGLPAPAAAHQI